MLFGASVFIMDVALLRTSTYILLNTDIDNTFSHFRTMSAGEIVKSQMIQEWGSERSDVNCRTTASTDQTIETRTGTTRPIRTI